MKKETMVKDMTTGNCYDISWSKSKIRRKNDVKYECR